MTRILRGVVILLFGILIFSFLPTLPPISDDSRVIDPDNRDTSEPVQKSSSSSVIGGGNEINSLVTTSRRIQDLDIEILNSYANPNTHRNVLDLSTFQIPGWTLYELLIDADNITAVPEREVLGVSKDISSFRIQEYSAPNGWRYTSLAQGFYEKLHDGQLLNYSFYYDSPIYSPAQHGWAYYSVLSDYHDSSSNLVGYTQLPTRVISGAGWQNATVSSVILDASTQYYVVINGSALIKTTFYPDIRWISESGTGTFESQQYDSRFSLWGAYPCEALLNYTYLPWNTTANAALAFSDPSPLSLMVNGTLESGLTWAVSSENNITALEISTNQSVSFEYELTLKYRRGTVSTAMWYADTSEAGIIWNITSILDYPELSGILDRNLTLSIPSDWTANHLFNDTIPTEYHDAFHQSDSVVVCNELSDASWILECSSPNYIESVLKFNAADASLVGDRVSIESILDINSTIESPISTPATTGDTSLRVFYQGALKYSENATVVEGQSHHQWDISSYSASNGLYTVELFWINGTEAGYHTSDIVVYYPTLLTSSATSINAFTDSTFGISVYLEDTFTLQGLDGDSASVVYSFGGEANISLTDHNNGTWTATVPTTGRSPDTYSITVCAEGYAIENQSRIINANLIHDTELLIIQWSNTDNISYVQTTELLIEYRRVGGTAIADATVNVTIDGNALPLTWDGGVGRYRITFNGTDSFSGFGAYDLVILAWKAGYKAQSDNTQQITIHEEYTSVSVNWSHGTNITFIEYSVLTIDYRMSNGTAIPLATVNVTAGTTTWTLRWNGTDGTYCIRFNGTDNNPGFGTHQLTILAGKLGYESQEDADYSLTLREEPTSLILSWSSGTTITYTQSTMLVVNYTMSDGSPVIGATVNVTIGFGFWVLDYNPATKTYALILNGSDVNPGLGVYSVTVLTEKAGFQSRSDYSEILTVILEPTSFTMVWSMGYNITFVQQTSLIVTYKMSDETPVMGAIVNVTINGHLWDLTWDGSSSYVMVFIGSDTPPGFGTHDLTIRAGRYGFINQIDTAHDLILREEPTSINTVWEGLSAITYVGSTILSVNYTMSNGTRVAGALVYVTIDSDTWNLTWDESTGTYRCEFSGSDDPPGLGSHMLLINASRFGFITAFDNEALVIDNEPTTLIVNWIPSNNITFTDKCVLSIRYLMNSNSSAITDATVIATFAGVPRLLVWNSTARWYYIFIDGDVDLPGLGTFSVTVNASRYGFDSASDSLQEIILRREPTSLSVYWTYGVNNPDFFGYTYLIVEYTYTSLVPVLTAVVNVTIGEDTWTLGWNQTESYYQLRFNGSDPVIGVGTHSLTVRAWKYGFIEQMNNDEVVILPVIPTLLDLAWTNGDTITYVERTTLQAFYRMFNETWITDATVNVTINGMTLSLVWNPATHAYERIFNGIDGSLDFTTYPILVRASQVDFQSHTNFAESLTKQLEPTGLVISWIGGSNITYFSETRLSVQFIMSNSSPITTGTLNATINGYVWNLIWNSSNFAYETLIAGNDPRLHYATFDVAIDASGFGYIQAMDATGKLTIRLEDTYITFEWIPSSTISYLDVTVFRIYYHYLNGSPVLTATVNASYVLLWPAVYNDSSGAYEIAFTGADIPSPALGPHTLFVLAWKANHLAHSDISQTLTIVQEDTSIRTSWLDGENTITYVESATMTINYSIAASGQPIIDASVTIRIGTDTWETVYNDTLKLYTFTFTGDMDPPGFGTYTLYISATYVLHEGFRDATDSSQTLKIDPETVGIHSYWIGGATITYVGSTILVVNYTMSDGSAIPLATVNVTIDSTLWNLLWHEASQTYRLAFKGSDSLPGFGFHELDIRAGRAGFLGLTDSTLTLNIIEESTTLVPRWSNNNQNNITYFEYTYLFVEYSMSNGSPILDASVNVTVDLLTLRLNWNATEGAYGIRFNGSDIVPGFGVHSLVIIALKYGFILAQNSMETLEIGKDPTTIQVSWANDDDISFVEYTTLMVYYRMSNGSPVPSATIDISIGSNSWSLTWNASAQAYCFTFTGNMDPPGMGYFIVDIEASGSVYASQSTSNTLTIHEESTSAIASWSSEVFDWTQSIILEVEYRDSYGRLIDGAILKTITIDGVPFTLKGSNGVYWFEFNNTFDLGHHSVVVNVSKYGYEFAANSDISFNIIEAATSLELHWNATTIDYLGQIDLTANYSYAGTGSIVPQGGVIANITIDGSVTLPLIESGDFWVVSLNGVYLDLGPHSVVVRAQAYGYIFAESAENLTVNEVATNALSIAWNPANLTIEYTDLIGVVVDYTYYGGDVPSEAVLNVTISGQVYSLLYSSGAWRTSILGGLIGIGIHDASISAWLYGYAPQTQMTMGLNVTLAANSFVVTWQPSNLEPTYVDIINVSVLYTQDYEPILEASVRLSINGTIHELTYSIYDEMWHFSIKATAIGLGAWNVTVTANKTGYGDGRYTDTLTVHPAATTLDVSVLSSSFYFDEGTIVYISYDMGNSSFVPGATLILTILGIEQEAIWNIDHWAASFDGTELGIGVHNLTITVSALGFAGQNEIAIISVLPIPTEVEYSSNRIAYAQEDIVLRFTYMDNRTSTGIPGALYFTDWTGSYVFIDLGNGTYLMQISGSSLHVGNYAFDMTLQLAGYLNGSGHVEIEARPIPTELLLISQISQYENETILIQAKLMDLAHSVSIDWAVITATLEGVQYFMLYDAPTQNYTLSFRLPSNINPGTHTISISANGLDCDAKEGVVELHVLPKSTYVLTLDVVDEIETGSELIISVMVHYDEQPVGNIPLTLLVVIYTQSDSRIHAQAIETDGTGVALITFGVPLDATRLEITALFGGSISVWPAESETTTVQIKAAVIGLLDMILRDPILLSMVVGGVSVPAIGIMALKRRRGALKHPIRPPIVMSTASSVEKISVVQPIDRLKAEIAESASGLTRPELSEKLGISSSKIGSLVRDLLVSDSSFYEVRDGTKRIIRKRE